MSMAKRCAVRPDDPDPAAAGGLRNCAHQGRGDLAAVTEEAAADALFQGFVDGGQEMVDFLTVVPGGKEQQQAGAGHGQVEDEQDKDEGVGDAFLPRFFAAPAMVPVLN